VVNRLQRNSRFIKLSEISDDKKAGCDTLVQKILDQANGVFLWVVLVLNELERALVISESVELLDKIVATSPEKIKDFVQTILQSIPQIHQQGAYYLLAVVMRTQGILTSRHKAVALIQAAVDATTKGWKEYSSPIKLAECAMLFDTADCGCLHNCNEKLAVITSNLVEDHTARAKEKERLAERCRGLEVDAKLSIQFTHRAIPEALQDFFFRDKSEKHVRDDLVTEILAWIALADVRLRCAGEISRADSHSWDETTSIGRLAYIARTRLRMYPGALDDSENMMNLLYHVTETILTAIYGNPVPKDQEWENWGWLYKHQAADKRILLGVFDGFQLSEFIGWLIDNKLSWENDRHRLLAYLHETIQSGFAKWAHVSGESLEFVLDKLRRRGVTLDGGHIRGHVEEGCQNPACRSWYEFVCRELHYGMLHCMERRYSNYPHSKEAMRIHWGGLENLLLLGGDPNVFLSQKNSHCRLLLGPSGETLFALDGGDPDWKYWGYWDRGSIRIPVWPGKISLEDFIKSHSPPNMARLLGLI